MPISIRRISSIHLQLSRIIREIGAASTVLLKNLKQALPLKAPRSIGIIGNGAGPGSRGPNGYVGQNEQTSWYSYYTPDIQIEQEMMGFLLWVSCGKPISFLQTLNAAPGWGSGTTDFPYLITVGFFHFVNSALYTTITFTAPRSHHRKG